MHIVRPGAPTRHTDLERRRRQHWFSLTQAEQAAAVRRMADAGHGDYTIASASGLAVEQVRRILGEREPET